MKNVRESNIELLRLISQFLIILYHLLYLFVVPYTSGQDVSSFYKALWIPLHIGVLIFVIISGYFGIKPTPKGLIRFLSTCLVYIVPNILISNRIGGDTDPAKSVLFVSNSHFWFVRTYLCLYVFTPVLNTYLKNITHKKRVLLLLSLIFIAIYLGTISSCDISLIGGKNLANFILLYVIGNTLSQYKEYWCKFSSWKYLVAFLFINSVLVITYIGFENNIIGKALWRLSFPYCSPFLLISSILIFLCVARIRINSNIINSLAKSSLAIYLIHGSNTLCKPLEDITIFIFSKSEYVPIQLLTLIVLAFVIGCLCILIDKMLLPVWKGVDKFAAVYGNKINDIYHAL